MKSEMLKEITDSITSKLGDETSGIIADDIGKLVTANTQTIETIDSLNKKIESLEETNKKLVAANGSLLQQIPAVADYESSKKEAAEEEKKAFNFRAVFDKNGNFKEDF